MLLFYHYIKYNFTNIKLIALFPKKYQYLVKRLILSIKKPKKLKKNINYSLELPSPADMEIRLCNIYF